MNFSYLPHLPSPPIPLKPKQATQTDSNTTKTQKLTRSFFPPPQPWLPASPSLVKGKQPKCTKDPVTGKKDCRSRDLWNGFYSDFARRRKEVCGMDVKRGVEGEGDVERGVEVEEADVVREKRWWDFEPGV